MPFSRAILLAEYYAVSLDYLAGRTDARYPPADLALTDDELRLLRQFRRLTERSKGKAELFIEQPDEM